MSSSPPVPSGAGLRNPRWLLFTHLLPAAVIVLFFLNAYRIVHTELEEEVIQRWLRLGGILLGLQALMLTTLVPYWRSRKPVPWPIALVSLLGHICLCAYYLVNMNDVIPWSIPRWMLPRELMTTCIGLLMIPILHALLMLVDRTLRPDDRSWRNILVALGVIGVWYLLFVGVDHGFLLRNAGERVWIPLNVLAVVVFFFFLVRGLILMVHRGRAQWDTHQLWWRVLIGLGLPFTGLVVHATVFDHHGAGPLGDFSSPWFFILAIVNGVIVCMGPPADPRRRLLFFFSRAAGFTYVLYFALVFLPYLPFSIIAIIFFGAGFLMLTPLVLFVVQLIDLMRDARDLSGSYAKWKIRGTLIAGLVVLPLCVYISFARDKVHLEEALAYVYAPDLDVEEAPDADADDVRSLIWNTDRHRMRGASDFGTDGVPLLSPWYEAQVFDGLALSDEKRDRLMRVFTGEAVDATRSVWSGFIDFVQPSRGTVRLTDLKATPTYEPATATWRTQVQLTMRNDSSSWGNAEFSTQFHLPPGAFITDNWLMIGDRKAKGILADRKAATWIYQQITTLERRDPSLLRYIAPDELEMRVYPFASSEVRTAGFEVVTKEPLPLTMDEHHVILGDSSAIASTPITAGANGCTYVSAAAKRALPSVAAKFSFWLVIDRSVGTDTLWRSYEKRIDGLMNVPPFAGGDVHFVLCGSASREVSPTEWRSELRTEEGEGGYFLGRAIERITAKALGVHDGSLPIVISITDHPEQALLTANVADLLSAANLPLVYFNLDDRGVLTGRAVHGDPAKPWTVRLEDLLTQRRVAWPSLQNMKAVLPDDGAPSIVTEQVNAPGSSPAGSWEAALALRGLEADLSRHPDRLLKEPHALTKASFAAHALARSTAFLCLESEAQEAALKKKQEEVLNASSLFDAGDELRPMSEPAEWIAGALFLLTLLIYRFIRRR